MYTWNFHLRAVVLKPVLTQHRDEPSRGGALSASLKTTAFEDVLYESSRTSVINGQSPAQCSHSYHQRHLVQLSNKLLELVGMLEPEKSPNFPPGQALCTIGLQSGQQVAVLTHTGTPGLLSGSRSGSEVTSAWEQKQSQTKLYNQKDFVYCCKLLQYRN